MRRLQRMPGRYDLCELNSGVGSIIAEAMEKVGKDGVITVEEGSGFEDELDVVEGMQFDRLLIALFREQPRQYDSELDDPFILLVDKKISNIRDLIPVLKALQKQVAIADC